MKKDKTREYYIYICPKCREKLFVEKNRRAPSLFCRNCLKNKQLNMLRLITPNPQNRKK